MSLEVQNNITLDFTVPRVKNVRCVQGDNNSRIVHITVTNNGEPFLITNTMTVTYKVNKPDGAYVWNKNGLIVNNGIITLTLSEQCTAVVGVAEVSLQVIEGEKILGTMSFNLIVEDPIVNTEEIISEVESDIVEDVFLHINDRTNPHKVNSNQIFRDNGKSLEESLQRITENEIDSLFT